MTPPDATESDLPPRGLRIRCCPACADLLEMIGIVSGGKALAADPEEALLQPFMACGCPLKRDLKKWEASLERLRPEHIHVIHWYRG